MRVIDRTRVKSGLAQQWLTTAKQKSDALRGVYDGYRTTGPPPSPRASRGRTPKPPPPTWKEYVQQDLKDAKTQDLWQDKALKALLMQLSYGKCWYCEQNVAERADNAVDHFRPKGRVAEDTTHEGYWWLAFDWENYRFACTFCNSARLSDDGSGGKQDHFRIWSEDSRARTPDDLIDHEQPMLLDPFQPDDPGYLTFEEDGRAVPAYSKEDDQIFHEQAAESIERYHLNRKWLRENRQKAISKVEDLLTDAEKAYRLIYDKKTVAAARVAHQQTYRNALKGLRASIMESAEFSAAARAWLSRKRGGSVAARAVIES